MIAAVGRGTAGFFTHVGAVALLLAGVTRVYAELLRGLVARRPGAGGRYAWRLVMAQMYAIGVRSLPVAAITCASTGMVFALEIGNSLIEKLGAPINVGKMVNTAMWTELGPVLTGLMVAARNGSAIAAELGTMRVTEQVEALSALGVSPTAQLVAPRVLACVLMLPVLTFFGDVVGILGGYFVATSQLGISHATFMTETHATWVSEVTNGLLKTFFFGAIIGVASCNRGLAATGGAEGVGRACISAVVWSCMAILVADYLLSTVLFG